jgi:3-isopropylmalate dehydrogenase
VLARAGERFGHELVMTEHAIGGAAIDAAGTALPEATRAACLAADAVLLGAVGGPRWDDPAAAVRPEQGLLGLRRAMGVYANLRPVRPHPALAAASPLRAERLAGVDLLVVRELAGGLYFGEPRGRTVENGVARAVDTLVYSEPEIERIVRVAFALARGRRRHVTSVDKANVLESSRLWRQVAVRVAAELPDVRIDHQLVDSAALRLMLAPGDFDVIVTENLFGDILSDEAAALAGSLGLLPSASLGEGGPGLYEPVHGSAPDIAGRGIANPIGAILSAAMLLCHSLGLEAEAAAVESAVDATLAAGIHTPDLGGRAGTEEVTADVIARLG